MKKPQNYEGLGGKAQFALKELGIKDREDLVAAINCSDFAHKVLCLQAVGRKTLLEIYSWAGMELESHEKKLDRAINFVRSKGYTVTKGNKREGINIMDQYKGRIKICENIWCRFNQGASCKSDKVEIAADGSCWTAQDRKSEG